MASYAQDRAILAPRPLNTWLWRTASSTTSTRRSRCRPRVLTGRHDTRLVTAAFGVAVVLATVLLYAGTGTGTGTGGFGRSIGNTAARYREHCHPDSRSSTTRFPSRSFPRSRRGPVRSS